MTTGDMMNRRNVWLVAAMLTWLGQSAAGAETAPSGAGRAGPMAFLQSHDEKAKQLLASAPGDSLSSALRDTLKEQINRVFDFGALSRLALGDYWETRTAAEQEHFVSTFSAIIREQNFDSFIRYYREGDITYEGENVRGDTARVSATVPLKREQIEIGYALHAEGEDWRVYDLVIDGVSTAEGNRRRYARYIEKHSYDRLIAQLDKQLARLCGATD